MPEGVAFLGAGSESPAEVGFDAASVCPGESHRRDHGGAGQRLRGRRHHPRLKLRLPARLRPLLPSRTNGSNGTHFPPVT